MNISRRILQNILKPLLPNSNEGDNRGELQTIADQGKKVFSFDVLVSATKNFHESNKLGQGGFGSVYKGKLADGRDVAVKKLSHNSNQGKKEFLNEAKLLARVQHKNIVNLLGYCTHGEEKLLVYEYVVNESVDKLLFKQGSRITLDWSQRHDIIMGVAKGLGYLHIGSHTSIIHRDIKASNILLDEKLVPKIADFGMARLFPEEETHVNTRVAGTNGYMAPEYVMHGILSVKADVFSFGVVVLELICGQKNSAFSQDIECQSLLDWVYNFYKKGKSLETMDPRIAPSANPDEIATFIHIGLLCVQSDPQLRPTMERVSQMLSRKPKTLEQPTRPGFPGSRYRKSHKPGSSLSTTGTSSASETRSFSGPRHRNSNKPATSLSPTGTSSASETRSFCSTTATNTATTTISSSAYHARDPHGKRPMVYDPDS